MVLDDVAVSARVNRRDRGIDGGHASDQQEYGGRSNLLRELQQFDAAGIRHADVGDDDVKDLGFQPSPRRFAVVGHLDTVAFLPEGDLQQLANRFFVVDNQNVSHAALTFQTLRCFSPAYRLASISTPFAPGQVSPTTLLRASPRPTSQRGPSPKRRCSRRCGTAVSSTR